MKAKIFSSYSSKTCFSATINSHEKDKTFSFHESLTNAFISIIFTYDETIVAGTIEAAICIYTGPI
jgi:hypothetical protein